MPRHKNTIQKMKRNLFAMLADQGGLDIPMNEPKGSSQNLRYRKRSGDGAADFPDAFVVDKPVNTNSK